MLKDLIQGARSLVFPPFCLICKDPNRSLLPSEFLCPLCYASLEMNRPPFCIKCSRHIPPPHNRILCRSCTDCCPSFDFAWGAYILNDPLKELIHLFKYRQRTGLRRLFSYMIREFLQTYQFDTAQFEVIVPVPLFASKLRERGYNQSLLLAESVSTVTSLPVNTRCLFKARPTKSQVDLRRKERWTNIRGAFTIKHSDTLKDKSVLLVDDLLTTGATLCEVSRTLRSAGTAKIGVLTLAIAP